MEESGQSELTAEQYFLTIAFFYQCCYVIILFTVSYYKHNFFSKLMPIQANYLHCKYILRTRLLIVLNTLSLMILERVTPPSSLRLGHCFSTPNVSSCINFFHSNWDVRLYECFHVLFLLAMTSHYGIFRMFACVLRANPSKSVAIVDKCCDS